MSEICFRQFWETGLRILYFCLMYSLFLQRRKGSSFPIYNVEESCEPRAHDAGSAFGITPGQGAIDAAGFAGRCSARKY
jgi:hypothetical protein